MPKIVLKAVSRAPEAVRVLHASNTLFADDRLCCLQPVVHALHDTELYRDARFPLLAASGRGPCGGEHRRHAF